MVSQTTPGQTFDDLAFRVSRLESWVIKFIRFQTARVNGIGEIWAEIKELGYAIGNSVEKKPVFDPKRFTEPVLSERRSILIKVNKSQNGLVECPACHMRFKNNLALKAHICNDANWGRRKFRALHQDARQKQVWRA